MKKIKNKQVIKASQKAKAENIKNKTITVKNAEGEPDIQAELIIQNKINYTPKVSVIIPVYNTEEYLRECLDSVINQTLKEIEIICVDDGSSDSSLEILKEYAKKDNRIVVISRENKGVGYSRNEGIKIAKGEFIAFMDPDDYYPDLSVIENMYKAAIKHQVQICGGSLIVYDEHKKIEIKKTEENEYFTENSLLLYQNFQYDYGFQRYIYKRDFIQTKNIYFPNYRRFQDPPFMIKAFAEAEKFYALKQYVYTYRCAYKTINWTEEKVYHLFCGLRDNLLISKKYNLETLFSKTLVRIKCEYKQILSSYDTEKIQNIKKEIMSICLQSAKNRYTKNQKQAKVSVVLPIYNAAPYLRECLDSIIKQTLKDIEIICVNDGSTDNSLDIIKEYAQKDIRIKYIDKPNAGYGQTMNCGMDLATGEYIGIVEPDDFIKPEMYETLYNKAKETKADVIKSDYYEYTNGKIKYRNITSANTYDKIINYKTAENKLGFSINPTGIFKKEFLQKYNIKFNETPGASHQDIGFSILLSFYSSIFIYINQAFYMYRQDNINSSMQSYANPNIMIDEYTFILENLVKNKNIFEKIKIKFYQLRHNSFMYFLNNRLSPTDKDYFLENVYKIYTQDEDFINVLESMEEKYKKDIKKILNVKKQIIPIVFATDDNYATYLSVAIKSLIHYANVKFIYRIFIFYTNINSYSIQLLKSLEQKNVTIDFVDVSKNIENYDLYSVSHFSKEMYYRLLIPEILNKYNKVLYLDCDILIQKDISNIYNENIEEYIMGVIKNPQNINLTKYKENVLNIKENEYFNSGVLLINNKKFRENNIKQKCFNILQKHQKFYCPDQDILNISCNGAVKYLDERWNFQWGHLFNLSVLKEGKKDYLKTSQNPFIIHFTTGKKPWNFMNHKFSELWWKYAKEIGITNKLPKKSKLKPWLLFPYNLCQKVYLTHKEMKLCLKLIKKQLLKSKVDVRALGKKKQAIRKLKNIIFAQNQGSEFVKKNIRKLAKKMYRKLKKRKPTLIEVLRQEQQNQESLLQEIRSLKQMVEHQSAEIKQLQRNLTDQ